MLILDDLIMRRYALSLIGLGYVGLPIAVAFSGILRVIGYDKNTEKIETYRRGQDPTHEVGDEAVASCGVHFTCDPSTLADARFHIIAVPTPIKPDHTPDLSPLITATIDLGRYLQPGSVVVYESTVYPGVTEEVCVPLLERESGLICGRDFFIGYSPERINPGDKTHRLADIVKVVSGINEDTLELIAQVYELVVKAGVYRAPTIKVAEAAKVIENSQRDLNIAFVNELSMIFHKLGIDTIEVLRAASTKWNFLNFSPGLVGGHCIGVDPYYLSYCAEQSGYYAQVILAGRRVNDGMGKVVAEAVIKGLIRQGRMVKGADVAILGFTFKENCPDTRNTRVYDIVKELGEYGVNPTICDPVADVEEMQAHYGIMPVRITDLTPQDAVIIAVAHSCFRDIDCSRILMPGGVLADVKGILSHDAVQGGLYWRL